MHLMCVCACVWVQELSFVRRAAVRSQEDAASAHEIAYLAAQKHHTNVIKDLQNALHIAQSNMQVQRSDMQQATLEAMMEVRRETLQKAFGANSTLARTTPNPSAAPPKPAGFSAAANEDGFDEEGVSIKEGRAPPQSLSAAPSKRVTLSTPAASMARR